MPSPMIISVKSSDGTALYTAVQSLSAGQLPYIERALRASAAGKSTDHLLADGYCVTPSFAALMGKVEEFVGGGL